MNEIDTTRYPLCIHSIQLYIIQLGISAVAIKLTEVSFGSTWGRGLWTKVF